MDIIVDNTITDCFVSPLLCKNLADAGLCQKVFYHWRVRGGMAALNTHEFDIDDYYIDGLRHQDKINPPEQILPAYNIKDVEKLLPAGYLLTMNSNKKEYQISTCNAPLERNWGIDVGFGSIAERMPDAFALLLLQCIKKNVVDLNQINTMLAR